MKLIRLIVLAAFFSGSVLAANTVPTEVQMPGTQPQQVNIGPQAGVNRSLDPAKQCNFCHANYNKAVEPGHNWGGSPVVL